jgi:hypothetical protein
MGGLIPNPHDNIIKQKLNKQFSDPKLSNLRKRIAHPPTEPHFFSDPGHPRHLHRISYRLKIWPDPDNSSGEPPPTLAQLKARWQYFLKILLMDPVSAAQKGITVADYIRRALHVFVVTDDPQSVAPGAPQCTAITFDAVPDDGTLPAGIDYRAHINPDPDVPRPAGPYVASIVLMCRTEIPPGVSAPTNPPADPGEVLPDQPSFVSKSKPKPKPKYKAPKKSPAKKTTKKKKKAANKVSKKAVKKATPKKAAKKAPKKAPKKAAKKAAKKSR